jgi:peroxin-13
MCIRIKYECTQKSYKKKINKMDLNDLNALKQDSNNSLQHPAPPIPPRSLNQNSLVPNLTPGYNGYNTYGSQFNNSSYSYPSTSNYLGMSSNYSMPFNTNAYSLGANNSSNSFLRAAEDSSRSAFQSIESVVYAFSAVSAMFESTYLAVYNSFRAVVGVADQFYRLKTHLMNIVSGLAVLKLLKKILRKIIRFLRLGKSSDQLEFDNNTWNMVNRFTEAENLVKETRHRQTNWPLIMFFGVVLGGPWLIWKILSSIDNLKKDDTLWMQGKIDHFIAVSEHDFDSVNVDELSFRKGQRIIIAPKG